MGFLKQIRQDKTDYFIYTKKEKIWLFIKGISVLLLLNYFFLRSLPGMFILIPLIDIFLSEEAKKKRLNDRKEAKEQFLELLLLLSNGLRAGYSVENSIKKTYPRICNLYGKRAPVARLIENALIAQNNSQPIAQVFINAGKEMKIKDMREFGEIYEIAHKRSGNMTVVMDKTAESIMDRLNVQRELYLELSEKMYEMKVMTAMPFVIMLYMEITSPGFFDPMYHTLSGKVLMIICLVIYTTAYCLSGKLVRFEI